MHRNVKIGAKWGGDYTLEEFNPNIGLRQGCSLFLTLFNISIDDILRKLDESNTHT
jgi:hypothetical protein